MTITLAPRLFPVPDQGMMSDDYYTPAWLFERMDISFDIDVCAPLGGVHWIPAARHFTMSDDGLAQPWQGRVWMNPPYSNSAPWVKRFIDHQHGIALVQHCRARWHVRLWEIADGLADPNPSTPNGSLFQFIYQGQLRGVYMPVVLAAFGDECVDAIARVGKVRR